MGEDRVLSYAGFLTPGMDGWCRRSGRYLVTGGNAVLPRRCVICGAGAEGEVHEVGVRVTGNFSMGWGRRKMCVVLGVSYCQRHGQLRGRLRRVQEWLLIGAFVGGFAGYIAGAAGLEMLPDAVKMILVVGIMGVIGGSVAAAGVCAAMAGRGPAFHHREGEAYYIKGVAEGVLAGLEVVGGDDGSA